MFLLLKESEGLKDMHHTMEKKEFLRPFEDNILKLHKFVHKYFLFRSEKPLLASMKLSFLVAETVNTRNCSEYCDICKIIPLPFQIQLFLPVSPDPSLTTTLALV